MIELSEFSELLASLHSTSMDAAQWSAFLDRVSGITHSSAALLLSHQPKRGIHHILALGGHRSREDYIEGQRLYSEYYGARDPFQEVIARLHITSVMPGEALLHPRLFKRTELYNDLLSRYGLEHLCVVPASNTDVLRETLALWREVRPGIFDKQECAWLGQLQPHLQAALRVQRALEIYEKRALRAEALLDAAAPAVFLLKHSGQVAYYNKSAERLIRQGDALRLVGRRLQTIHIPSHKKFEQLVAQAAKASGAEICTPGGALLLPPNRESGNPLHVLVAPLRIYLSATSCSAHVVVIASDPSQKVSMTAQILRDLWECTPAEAELANHLVADRTLEEIAALRGVTKETIRTQTKSLMAKTDTRRQSQLVRLLLSLPSKLHPNGV
jgi:DNA-binding CsgD family transcriptional regulator/PAS domain-containing protein